MNNTQDDDKRKQVDSPVLDVLRTIDKYWPNFSMAETVAILLMLILFGYFSGRP